MSTTLRKLARNNRGQILIEAMIAISVISLGLLVAFSLLSNSLAISKVASNQYVGTYLAAEGIEVVKNIIDTNVQTGGMAWNANLVNGSGPYSFAVEYDSAEPDVADLGKPLLFDPSTDLYNYETGDPTDFVRTVTVTEIGSSPPLVNQGDELQVDSTVTWTDEGGLKDSVTLEDDFYNWDQVNGG